MTNRPFVRAGGVWFALLAVCATPVTGQSRAPAPAEFASLPGSVSNEVSVGRWLLGEVAQRWSVAPARLEVDWGDTPTRLVARAAQGASVSGGSTETWVLTLPADGADASRRLLVRVGVRRPTPVAAREITRGAMIGEADVRWVSQTMWGPPTADATDPVGMQAQRRVSTGDPLIEPAVLPGPWVRSRDPVEVLFQKGQVTIGLRGTALADGRPGERVHVRLEDGRRVQGRAIAPGRVALDPGGDR